MPTCNCADGQLTVRKYLSGKVRNITVPDDAIVTICADASISAQSEIHPDSYYGDLSVKELELACAWLYVWVAGSPAQTGSTTDEDADWKHTEGGERMSANVLKHYLDMANEIFDKYDLPTVGEEKWGFVGRGIHNPRTYNPRR